MQLQQHPEFNNYLAFIMTHLREETPEFRQRAGLMLKNNVVEQWDSMQPMVRQYIVTSALQTIGDPNAFIRQTVGTVSTCHVHY
jgi:transportin-1